MNVAVVGATGYLGAELLRLLVDHPTFKVGAVQAGASAGTPIAQHYPGLASAYGSTMVTGVDPDVLAGHDIVFIAVPSGASQPLVRDLVGKVGLVVDLGADFRLKDPAMYPTWYHFVHEAPELLETAVFGLVELGRDALRGAQLIASPGCYVTAASLALAPVIEAGLIERTGIIVDAASGTSGAGKELRASSHYAWVNENFSAYGLLTHRHTPEIEQTIGAQVLFTPHLAPMTRGILATCYGRPIRRTSTTELIDLYRERYRNDPFIDVTEDSPSTRETYGSNTVRITARYDERTSTVLVLSALDNLTKGGAGQALQAANVAIGIDETAGLPKVALLP